MEKAYKFRLYPTAKQEKFIRGEIRSEITLGKPAIIHRDDPALSAPPAAI